MKASGRTKGGAPFEAERAWDRKNPDRAIAKKVAKSEPVADEEVEAADEEKGGEQ